MQFGPFLVFQIRQYLLRPRWLLAFPAILFVAYRSTNAVVYQSTTYYNAPSNAWDAAFHALGSADAVYLLLSALFLYLVCDLLPEPRYGQWALMRLGSRQAWWLAKVLTVFLAALLYTALTAVLVLGMASLRLPLESTWSVATNDQFHFIEIGLTKDALNSPPLVIYLQMVLLLGLGWLAMGLVTLAGTLLSHRPLVGFLAGATLLLAGYVGAWASGMIPTQFPYILLPSFHMEYTPGPMPIRQLPVATSVLYWLVWAAVLTGAGLAFSRRQDYFAHDQTA
ncbi:MAG: hypothetical protein GYA17_10135 [Chloroflexi bacterium]|nr:hypothetical protein [Chloroflexota bacterium]